MTTRMGELMEYQDWVKRLECDLKAIKHNGNATWNSVQYLMQNINAMQNTLKEFADVFNTKRAKP